MPPRALLFGMSFEQKPHFYQVLLLYGSSYAFFQSKTLYTLLDSLPILIFFTEVELRFGSLGTFYVFNDNFFRYLWLVLFRVGRNYVSQARRF